MSSSLSTTAQVLAALGVNVHVEYTDGKYASTKNVIADLAYLGISHVRDAVLSSGNQGQASYDALASAGIRFDLFFSGNTLGSTLKLVDAFEARHPGAISMIEGPNEVNNFPIKYNGLSGNAAATSYQSALYQAVHSDASLKGVPVANLTSWPDLAGSADYANFHSYPKGGVQPAATLTANGGSQLAVEAGKPLVMTEGGYTTLTSANYFGGVDETTQAKLTIDMILDNAKSGVVSTYLYELLDAYADTSNSDPNKHFGLFRLDNSPKPVATAIHNLTTILSTNGDASATPFTPSFSLPGATSGLNVLSLTKNASTADIVVWAEPKVWDSTTSSEVAAPRISQNLHLGVASDVKVFDPLQSTTAIAQYSNVRDVSISITDHALIVEVTPHLSGQVVYNADGSFIEHDALNDLSFSFSGTLLSKTIHSALGAVTEQDTYVNGALSTAVHYNAAGAVTETDSFNFDGSWTAHSGLVDTAYTAAGAIASVTTHDAAGHVIEVDRYQGGAVASTTHYDSSGAVIAPTAPAAAASSNAAPSSGSTTSQQTAPASAASSSTTATLQAETTTATADAPASGSSEAAATGSSTADVVASTENGSMAANGDGVVASHATATSSPTTTVSPTSTISAPSPTSGPETSSSAVATPIVSTAALANSAAATDPSPANAGSTASHLASAESASFTKTAASVSGGVGDDTLHPSAGDNVIDGGGGDDTLVFSGFAHDYAMSVAGGAGVISGGPEGGIDTLTGIENISFLDGTLTFDLTSEAAQIVRLYDAFLGRAPDVSGLNGYLQYVAQGHTLADMAANAASSAEFQSHTAGLTDTQFVEYVYENTLHREADPTGLATYVAGLADGAFTRTSLILQAAESPEHVALTAGLVEAGVWQPNQTVEGLELLYDASVQRAPDAVGLSGYGAMVAGGSTFRAIANQMASSAEFLAHHAGQTDAEYIDSLYVAEVGRHADPLGMAAYADQLQHGYTRGDILWETALSQEHQSHVLDHYDPLVASMG